jgi:predicted amidohydrolase
MKPHGLSRRSLLRNAAVTSGMVPLAASGFSRSFSGAAREQKSHRAVWIAGLSQMWVRSASARSMTDQVMTMLEEVVPFQPDFVCLPELFAFENIERQYPLAEKLEISAQVLDRLAGFSRQNNCYTICPVYTAAHGRVFNSSVFLDRQGERIGVYNKIHPTEGEMDHGVGPGALNQPVIPTEYGPVGSQICFDINWDDGWSMLHNQGAKIVFWPSAFDGGKMVNTKAWMHKYVVATATNQNNSRLCDSTGETVAQTGIWNKHVFCAPVNLEKVFLHLWPYVSRFPDIRKKYGRKVRITLYHEEQWAVIESLSPDVFVKDILKEFELKTHEEHIRSGEVAQNRARS